jgi:hypothetical protein
MFPEEVRAMNPTNLAEPAERSAGHPIIWNGLILGVLSGAFLSATAYYKIVAGEDSAVIAFAPLVGVAWIVAGFRASKRAASTKSGVAAGLLAGVVGAAIGAAVDQALAHQFINQWVTHLNAGCDPENGYFSCIVDAPTQLAREAQATIWGLVALPIVGLVFGLLGGIVGPGSALRALAYKDDPELDESGRPRRKAGVPLIKSFRAGDRSDGTQRTDSPDFFGH